jgi:catechol 2,3-dioxygenase-like lactoylglutathione lyase family enzyme
VSAPGFRVESPNHVTIAVRDRDAAVERLALFGFTLDHVAHIDGGEPARYMGMPEMDAEHITLVLEGSDPRFEIQLLCIRDLDHDGDGTRPSNLRKLGFNHLALKVSDLRAVAAHLEANGVRALNDEMDYLDRKLRFFEGPEGVTIELVE